MLKPELPPNESVRLGHLRSLRILDTPAEERFDRLTRLAKRLLDVPIALVSLVDEHRQWFKSSTGLDVRETPREDSFCGHAILGDDYLVVPDATKDARFADNPLVTGEPHIRFYAGIPLKCMDGTKLGTFCVIDTKPRKISKEDLLSLKDLTEIAEREIIAVQLATMDDLTGIANRRGFSVLAQNSLNLCVRNHIPASLVFFDINNFKKINDTFGHLEGDHALVRFADLMRHTFRESDVIARLSGDEFVVLMTNSTVQGAEELIERFRTLLDISNRKSTRGYNITFSSGVVSVDAENAASLEQLLDEADSLMYKKKKKEKVYFYKKRKSG